MSTLFVILTQVEQGASIILREVKFFVQAKPIWETRFNDPVMAASTSRIIPTESSTSVPQRSVSDDEGGLITGASTLNQQASKSVTSEQASC